MERSEAWGEKKETPHHQPVCPAFTTRQHRLLHVRVPGHPPVMPRPHGAVPTDAATGGSHDGRGRYVAGSYMRVPENGPDQSPGARPDQHVLTRVLQRTVESNKTCLQ